MRCNMPKQVREKMIAVSGFRLSRARAPDIPYIVVVVEHRSIMQGVTNHHRQVWRSGVFVGNIRKGSCSADILTTRWPAAYKC